MLESYKTAPCWFLNCTDGSTLCSPAFSHFLQKEWIKRTNSYKTYIHYICFFKKVSKETNHSDSHVIENFIIGTTSEGLDIQRLSIWMSWPGNQTLYVVPHQYKIIYLHLGSSVLNFNFLINLERFDLSCVYPVHCLFKSTDSNHMQTVWQRI